MGSAEALVAEEAAIAGLMDSGNAIGELMGEIKRQRLKTDQKAAELTVALRGGDRNTKVKFNFAVEAFAAEINHAIAAAEPEAKAMTDHVTTLHETQAILYGEKPPQAWIDQHDYYQELRTLSREAARIYSLADDSQYRGKRNDLDAALDRRLELRRGVASAWSDFEILMTKRIKAVEKSRR